MGGLLFMNNQNELENLILATLSFYEKMDFSKIVLDLDATELKKFPQFQREDLEKILTNLQKKKLIRAIKEKDQLLFLRVHPPKSFWSRIKSYLRKK